MWSNFCCAMNSLDRMDNRTPVDDFYGQQPEYNEWSSQYTTSIEEIDRMTASQFMNGSQGNIGDPHPPVVTSSSSRKKQVKQQNLARRGGSFTKEEDKILCSAFLNVSKDPIVGANQSSGGYYKRVHDYFCKHKPEGSTRSQLAIQHRWQGIQKAVNIFCSCKSAVDRKNESGKCEQDRIEDAILMFEKKEPFNFLHCWKMLHKEPKWNDRMLELNRAAHTSKSAPTAAVPSDNENDTISRPEGRDSAKKRKGNGEAASSSTAADVLQKIHERHGKVEEKQEMQMQAILNMKTDKMKLTEKMFELQKEDMENRKADMDCRKGDMERRNKLKEEQLLLTKQDIELKAKNIEVQMKETEGRAAQNEALLLTAELGIMGADLEKLAPSVRSYYIIMQQKILERRGIHIPPSHKE